MGQLPGQRRWLQLVERLGAEDGPFTNVHYDVSPFPATKAKEYLDKPCVEDQLDGQEATDKWCELIEPMDAIDLYWEIGDMRVGGKQKGETEGEAVMRMFKDGATLLEVMDKRPNTWRTIHAMREVQQEIQAPTTSSLTRLIAIWGGTGMGKTSEASAWCKANGIKPRIMDSAGICSSGTVWPGDQLQMTDEAIILENFDYREFPISEFIKWIDHKKIGPKLWRRKGKDPLPVDIKTVIITSTDDPATWWEGHRRYDEGQRRIEKFGVVRHREKPLDFGEVAPVWPADEDINWVSDTEIVDLTIGADEELDVIDISSDDEMEGELTDHGRAVAEEHALVRPAAVDGNWFLDQEATVSGQDQSHDSSEIDECDMSDMCSFIDDESVEEPDTPSTDFWRSRRFSRTGAASGLELLNATAAPVPGEDPAVEPAGHPSPQLSMDEWLGQGLGEAKRRKVRFKQ